jgi:hypothetical protein
MVQDAEDVARVVRVIVQDEPHLGVVPRGRSLGPSLCLTVDELEEAVGFAGLGDGLPAAPLPVDVHPRMVTYTAR